MQLSLVLITLFLSARPSAQASPLPQYWDALEAARTLAAVVAVRRPELTDPHADVAEGLLRLRRYELTLDNNEIFHGRRLLERAVARAPGDAWAHFALGAMLVRGPDSRIVKGDDPAKYVVSAFSLATLQAPRMLRRALELQPTLHHTAYVFAQYALDIGTQKLLEEAVQMLEQDGRARVPRALLLRAEVLARLRADDRSVEVADSARINGGDAALTSHARASVLLRNQATRAAGAAEYFAGVDALTDESADAFFHALSILATDDEERAWHGADLNARRRWLREFWAMHAALAGVSVEERLAEHYRRFAQVRAQGRTAAMGAPAAAPGGEGDVRAEGVASFEALMMVRHGDPLRAQRVMYCGNDVLDLPQPVQPDPADCLNTAMGRFRALRSSETRLYAINAGELAAAGSSYYPDYRTHLAMAWDVLQFRGVDGRTDVVAATAVPAASAGPLLDVPGQLRARLTVAIIDTSAMHVQRREIPLAFALQALPPSGQILLSGVLSAEPRLGALYRVTLTNMDATAGRIAGGRLNVRSYAHNALDLSDLVIAPQDGTRAFQRGSERVSLAPGRQLRRDEQFTLYYEIYGVRRGETYRTDLAVEPVASSLRSRLRSLLPGAPEMLRLTFNDEAADVHALYGIQETRSVAVGGLLPGVYRLKVTITTAAGAVAVREQMLYVADDAR
jgi:hypothetical protein